MITFNRYREDGRVPTRRVSKIGGIYRQDTGLIRLTLIDGNERSATARVHLLWEPWELLVYQEAFDFAMREFKRGTFADGGLRMH